MIHRVPEGRQRWKAAAAGAPVPRETGAGQGQAVRGGGKFLLEFGHVLLARRRADEELRRHLPHTATLLASLPRFGSRKFGTQLKAAFPLCDNISIDYAVLEKAKGVHGIAAGDFGWNDVGSWNAV